MNSPKPSKATAATVSKSLKVPESLVLKIALDRGFNPDTLAPDEVTAIRQAIEQSRNQTTERSRSQDPHRNTLSGEPAPPADGQDLLNLEETAATLKLSPEETTALVRSFGHDPDRIPRSEVLALLDIKDEALAHLHDRDRRIEKARALDSITAGNAAEILEIAHRRGERLGDAASKVEQTAFLNARLRGQQSLYHLETAIDSNAKTGLLTEFEERGNGLSPDDLIRQMGEEATRRRNRADTLRRQQTAEDWTTRLNP
ncbi:hypothetical protein [Lyngbya sp. CCY1209]|uniref:hypothetical protein n=1 Tax=Lyngbya sp. CCY1209 TaxID=2886103 RepID=UPI002D20B3A2|nr:hypothetical protein [Lyngbya sp. CCY1209]MEB3886145.1 hypothetical protein [Lyngbya sp. CCY1209]